MMMMIGMMVVVMMMIGMIIRVMTAYLMITDDGSCLLSIVIGNR